MLETLENELPKGTIRYNSKVVHIEIDGWFKSVHLADGTVLKTKALATHFSWADQLLGAFYILRNLMVFGKGVRLGVIPFGDHGVYWFFTFSPSEERDIVEDPSMLKQLILTKLGKVADKIKQVIEKTQLANMVFSPLRSRHPLELLCGNISKDNICVVGDALHPMTRDIGQGGCLALEDSVVLARFLAEALKERESNDEENGQRVIQKGLEKFGRERKWRDFDLTCTSYMVGFMQQSDGFVMNFIRDNKIMAKLLAGLLMKKI